MKLLMTCIVTAGAVLATSAWAQESAKAPPTLALTAPKAPLVLTAERMDDLAAAVMPRTSVERRLGSQAVTASAGFLCGLQPGQTDNGAAAAFGSDPHGRFVGAKLSWAF